MSKQVIDWQKDGLLAARGSGSGGRVQLEQVSLQLVGENADGRTITLEEALHRASTETAMRGEVTVIASREIVEVRTIQVPRVDAGELPDIIRFQAQRQLSNMTESWALDFVMLPPTPGQEMQTALVGAVSAGHLAEIDRICAGAGLQVTRVLLRPIEIARFAIESGSLATTGASMIACVSDQNAELLILSAGHVVQVRGTRLPSEPEQVASSLKGEIRRSLMAASPQIGNVSLSNVLLISTSATASQLDGVIAEACGAPVTHLDPTNMLSSQLADRDQLASASTHRLAGIAGAINADKAEKKTLLDFKNPKKRPPKKKNTTRNLLYGGVAAVLVLGGLAWWVRTNNRLDQDIAFFRAQTTAKAESVKWAQNKVSELREVQDFLQGSPNWLDELTYISTKMPESKKIIFESPTFTAPQRDGSAIIRVPVRANESNSIGEFERSLRDEAHSVQGSDPAELPNSSDGYKWRVVEAITITGRGWNVFDGPKAAVVKDETSTSVDSSSSDATTTSADTNAATDGEPVEKALETTTNAEEATVEPTADAPVAQANEDAGTAAKIDEKDVATSTAAESTVAESTVAESTVAESTVAAGEAPISPPEASVEPGVAEQPNDSAEAPKP